MSTPTSIVAYLALFAAVGFAFLLVSLLLGRMLRASVPSGEKLEPYECGEPSVGSSFVQFDLRFYVVALVFIIFEVEVALFFPPATVFGKAAQAMDAPRPAVSAVQPPAADANAATGVLAGLSPSDARTLALVTLVDLGAFFAVILVGFAYVWWRGDLDWVRAIGT
jgi:NADH-quinone oxidoreductase subunit A